MTAEVAIHRYSAKQEHLKISQNSQEKTCVGASEFSNFIIKESPAQVASYEFYENIKDIIVTYHLTETASKIGS